LAVADLVEIEKLPAYTEGLGRYLLWPKTAEGIQMSRSLNHVYPPERNVVQYDEKLTSGESKLVSTRVAALLEDEKRLQHFAQGIKLQLIQDQPRVEGNVQVGFVKTVEIPPREGEEDPYGRPVTQSHIWWLNDPSDYREQPVPYITAAETFCLRSLDQSPGRRPMAEMHERLVKAIDLKIEALLMTYLPQWQSGGGLSQGIAAVGMPEGDQRNAKLRSAVRVALYQELVDQFKPYLEQKETERRSGSQSRTLPDEIAFVELMLKALSVWIQSESV
jgi:hypothetical protein